MKKRPPGLVHWKTSLGVEYLKTRVKWKRIDWIQPNPPPLKAEIWKLFYLMQFFIRGPLVPHGNPLFHEVLCIFQNKNFASIKFSSYLQKPIEICCCIGSVFFFSSFCNFFLKNGQIPASFSFIFGLFKQTIHFFTTNQCEICPNVHPVYGAGIRTHDLSTMSRYP